MGNQGITHVSSSERKEKRKARNASLAEAKKHFGRRFFDRNTGERINGNA